MAFDKNRCVTVLFGGDDTVSERDTWEYDGTTRVQRCAQCAPMQRNYAAMAYDPTLPGVVMFGGEASGGGGTTLADTWVYDGTNWSEVSSAVHPSLRMFHGLTFDETRNEIVLFGGSGIYALPGGYADFSGETWAFGPRGAIPAVTEWGLLVMTLLIAVAGSLVWVRSARRQAEPGC